MKKIVILWFYLILLLFIHNNACCQKDFRPGYILTNNIDTIYGLINLRSNNLNSSKCEFKKEKNAEIEIYSPNEINSYVITDNKFYVSKTINLNGENKKVFLEYLVNGIVDLYYYNENNSEYYYIEKDNILTQLNNDEKEIINQYEIKLVKHTNQYIGVLKYLFNDAPELSNQISNTPFEYNSLINLTKNYHNSVCKDYKCIDYSKFIKKEFYCEFHLGLNFSRMGVKSSNDFAKNFKNSYSVNLRMKQNRINSRLDFLIGLNYSRNYFSGLFENKLYHRYYKFYYIEIEYSLISIPITIEYLFSNNRIQPIISLTYNNILLINPVYKIEMRNYLSNDTYSSIPNNSPIRKYEYGLSPGVGVLYNINKNTYLNCNLIFEYRKSIKNYYNTIFSYHYVTSMIFNIGYGFRIK